MVPLRISAISKILEDNAEKVMPEKTQVKFRQFGNVKRSESPLMNLESSQEVCCSVSRLPVLKR